MALKVGFKLHSQPDYFDLTCRQISEAALFEKNDESTCYIALRSDASEIFKGFKLTDNPLINVCIDLTFFKSSSSNRYIPRITFRKVDKNFATREREPKEQVIFALDDSGTAENFWKVIGFLFDFKELVDSDAFHASYKVVDNSSYVIEFGSKEEAEKIKTLSELVEKSNLSEDQIEDLLKGSRETNLKHFHRLLTEANSWKAYQTKYKDEMDGTGQEAVWHHFLKKHHWFLGLNVDIRFIRDLITEGSVGITNTEGRGSPWVDFIGLSDYTVLIELKTPETDIFTATKRSTARANTWSFTPDFIDGVSQCLGQKFDWDKTHMGKDLILNEEVVDQRKFRTVDPKAVFIIGNKEREFPMDSADIDVIKKRETFERFRRNCRNVEIITYDELYERAFFIVHNMRPEQDAKEECV